MAIFRQVKQDMFHQNWDTGYRTTLPIKPLASALKNYGAAMTEAKQIQKRSSMLKAPREWEESAENRLPTLPTKDRKSDLTWSKQSGSDSKSANWADHMLGLQIGRILWLKSMPKKPECGIHPISLPNPIISPVKWVGLKPSLKLEVYEMW